MGVDHDDTDTERSEDGKMHLSWQDTMQLWDKTYNCIGVDGADKAVDLGVDLGDGGKATKAINIEGVGYRGNPPKWWVCLPLGGIATIPHLYTIVYKNL